MKLILEKKDNVFYLFNYSRNYNPLVMVTNTHPLNMGRKKKGRRSKW